MILLLTAAATVCLRNMIVLDERTDLLFIQVNRLVNWFCWLDEKNWNVLTDTPNDTKLLCEYLVH